jgi:hypothetical protein
MIKYLLTNGSVLLFSVGFLYYLIQNPNFVPSTYGGYQWVNILVFFFLLLLAIFSLGNLIIFGFRKLFFKDIAEAVQIRRSIRYSILLTLGILIVYLLHFYHILSFWWGLGILIVVILALFVI